MTKDELFAAVWPDVAVTDGSLATAVSKVRKSLADDGRIIVTVPRIGYKLAAAVDCMLVPRQAWTELQLAAGHSVPGRNQWILERCLSASSDDVWLAHHVSTLEQRVFKFASDDICLRRLEREVTVARLLRESLGERREFVRILEWNFDSRPYFLESRYAGPSLLEWAGAQGGLRNVPLALRLELLVAVTRAIAAMHELNVLHRDLKPANILVGSGSHGTPQITISTNGTEASTGTLMYVAPEVLAGESPSAACDVYALGVLLYQLVSGDFHKPLAPGWESEIPDTRLREDIADAACGDPARRLKNARELADRLVNLDRR